MSRLAVLAVVAVGFAWAGWIAAAALALVLRRRVALAADAEHELRGAVTALELALRPAANPLERLQLDRMQGALADLRAAARAPGGAGAHRAPEGGRLAQVLGNLVANAAEHGVGPVEVRAERSATGLVRLELVNRTGGARPGSSRSGRGRGILIAQRAARELGGRVTVRSQGGFTRAVVELPAADRRDRAA